MSNNLSQNEKFYERETRFCMQYSPVFFQPSYAGAESRQKVLNLSLGGIGLDISKFKPTPEINEIIPGRLLLAKQNVELSIKVIHQTDKILGCEFMDTPHSFLSDLRNFLKVELSAHNLVKIDPKILNSKHVGEPFYFRGKNGDEVYFLIKNGRLELFSLTVNGCYITGGHEKSFKFGKVLKIIDEKPHGYKKMEPIEWTVSLDPKIIEESKRFVDNIHVLFSEHRTLLLETLSRAKHLSV